MTATSRTFKLLMAVSAGVAIALVLGTRAIAGATDSPCTCWYHGYEDGLESPIEELEKAEFFKACSNAGQKAAYEQGFKTAREGGERICPL